MENKAHAFAAGLFVLVVTALLVALAAWLTRDTGERRIYEISSPEAVNGLQSQAPVRYRGVAVGKVTGIGFDPKAMGNVLVTLALDDSAPVTRSTYASLGFQGVTGLAFVQLDDGGKAAPPLAHNDDQPPRIPLKPSLFGKLAERGEVIIDQVEKVTVQLNKLLADDNQKRIAIALEGAAQATQNVATLSARMQVLLDAQLGPERVNVPALVKEATATMKSLQASSDKAGQAVDEVARTARRLNEKDGPIDRLAEGTQALSAAADAFNAATLPRINQATEETSRAVRRLSRAANAINDNPQSLIFGNGAANPGPGEPGFVAPQGGNR